MEYSVRVWSAVQGDVVPLRYVAEAMARCAATGYGTLPLHGPTLKNLRPERALLLLDAVRNGQLTVCDSQGRIANPSELVDTAKELADELSGAVPAEAMNAEAIVSFLHARRQHLIEWGKANGDIFLFVETPGTLVESDLRDFLCDANDPGYGRVIEPGHNRGHIGGGECEPWYDNLPGTALAPTATPAPVVVMPKQRAQEVKILKLLADQGYDALRLQNRAPGKPGPKAEIKTLALNEPALFTKSSFEKAWERLRNDGAVAGAE